MKTSISHIPEQKQQELLKIVDIIRIVSVENRIRIDMIILFGSYARGDFVVKDVVREGPHTLEYQSDFDILVITKNPAQEKNVRLGWKIEQRISETGNIATPVSILVEDIRHVNARLEENRYFYLDIKREGVVLLDSGKIILKDARTLSPEEALSLKREDFDLWFSSASEFLIDYQHAFDRGSYKIAVFYLHQATERYITTYLLVMTGYKPKSHDLEVLYDQIKKESTEFDDWFSLEREKEHFELLRRAYVDSRYSKTYSITREELIFLEVKVKRVRDIVHGLCMQEIGDEA